MQRTVVVRVRQAEKLVEPTLRWQELGVVPEMPFAEDARSIPLLFAEAAQQRFLRMNSRGARVVERPGHTDAVGIAAGQQRGARRRAATPASIPASEANAPAGPEPRK